MSGGLTIGDVFVNMENAVYKNIALLSVLLSALLSAFSVTNIECVQKKTFFLRVAPRKISHFN